MSFPGSWVAWDRMKEKKCLDRLHPTQVNDLTSMEPESLHLVSFQLTSLILMVPAWKECDQMSRLSS